MEPTADLAPGSRFEDRYEVLGELGKGSFSRVYQARQISTGQSVAIKLLAPREGSDSSTASEVERFRREMQICAALSHTNIIRLLDSGQTAEGRLYAVFEHVPGETLSQAIEHEGRLPVRESIRLMTQVLDALSSAHAKGIVHRDLKPANIMLSGTGSRRNALVLDFGLGGVAEGRRRKEWQTLTQSREFLGTPLYAAPEQLAGETPSERSDLYAWGLVFLECLTGRHPFETEGAAARLLTGGGAVEIPDWLRDHRLGELLASVTAREPAKRDLSVDALIEALDAIAARELPVAPEQAPIPAPLTGSGERRHLTVMFCDLFGSTALSQQLDAETWREIVRAYQARGAEAVERYAGHVVQYLGDGLLVYFGYPQAHEDDAERAIRAGREVLRGLELLSAQTQAKHGVALQARVGIHTGPVVVGEMGGGEKKEVLALGDTPNIAARLEGFAEPGTVVVSDATLRLVAGIFVTEDRGVPELKGISEPIRVHRIGQPSGVRSRLERATRLTPFVGREQELGLLLDRFEQVQEGRGQAVFVAGEAGIGKSRLIYELREKLRDQPHGWLECRTSPYTQSSALNPLIEMLEGALDVQEEDSSDEKLEKLERGLAHVGLDPDEAVPLLASLLSLRLPERYAPLEISPQLQRQKTLEALLAWVLALGEKQPLLLVVEDLHWIDPSTLEWLGLLIDQCPTESLLLLMTHRPEFESPWPGREHLHAQTLSRLTRRQSRELVARSTADARLTEEVIERIAGRSDGVPLFAEELTKEIIETSSTDREVPETLQDSLMARLDRLGEAKEVAQVGAAIGRDFEHALLQAVAPVTEPALRDRLERLVEAELVYRRGLAPKATYTFKHALVQDAAYQSLLDSQRKELHGRIADALAQYFPERIARKPEEIARHCEHAGRAKQAIAHYERAGLRAAERSANAEAIAHFERALDLLMQEPESPARDQREIELQIRYGNPLMATLGYGAREVGDVYSRALFLCERTGDREQLLPVIYGLWAYHFSRAELGDCRQVAARMLAEAIGEKARVPLMTGHRLLAFTLFSAGEIAPAYRHAAQALAHYRDEEDQPLALTYSQNPKVAIDMCLCWTKWALGYPAQALTIAENSLSHALALDHPHSLAYALAWTASRVHMLRGEAEAAAHHAVQAAELSREQGFPVPLAHSEVVHAWALARQGRAERAREVEIRAIEDYEATGGTLNRPWFFAILCEIRLSLADLAGAAEAIRVGLSAVDQLGVLWWAPELYRLQGELAKHRARDISTASACLERALSLSRTQEARSLELRAATSLARLWEEEGEPQRAYDLLFPVYDWFTEGFETADLRHAKELLEELA